MNAVNVCLLDESEQSITIYPDCVAASDVQDTTFDLRHFQDFVFELGKLWNLNLDQIKNYWTCNLFAGGRIDHGKRVNAVVIHIHYNT